MGQGQSSKNSQKAASNYVPKAESFRSKSSSLTKKSSPKDKGPRSSKSKPLTSNPVPPKAPTAPATSSAVVPATTTSAPQVRTSSYSSPSAGKHTQQPPLPPARSSVSYGSGYSSERNAPSRQFSLNRQNASSSVSSTQAKHSQIEKYFTKYIDQTEDAILAEGMEKFCVDLGVDPAEFIVLVLAWKFEASQMCRFTREEFMNGCQKMRAHDSKSLKERFPELLAEAKDEKNFKELYNFTFSFGLDCSSGQRSLPIDMAIPLWDLVFTQGRPPLLDRWFAFLRANQIKGISRDTWNMFLPFVTTILPDLSNYDESEAWPSLFDDFVEHEQYNQA